MSAADEREEDVRDRVWQLHSDLLQGSAPQSGGGVTDGWAPLNGGTMFKGTLSGRGFSRHRLPISSAAGPLAPAVPFGEPVNMAHGMVLDAAKMQGKGRGVRRGGAAAGMGPTGGDGKQPNRTMHWAAY